MRKFGTRLVAANLTLFGLVGCALEDAKLTPVFRSVTAERSANWQTIFQIGKTRLSAGYYGLALQKFRIAFAKNPKSISVMNALAVTYDRLGRAELAEVYYAKALALEPDSVQTLNNYGYSKLMREQFAEAIELFDRAMTKKPTQEMVGVIAGNRNLAISKRQVAMQQIEKVVPAMSVMAEKFHQRNCLHPRTVQIEPISRRVHTLITQAPESTARGDGSHAVVDGDKCRKIAAKREHFLISNTKTPKLFSRPDQPLEQPDPPKAAPRIAVIKMPLPTPAAVRERNTAAPETRPQRPAAPKKSPASAPDVTVDAPEHRDPAPKQVAETAAESSPLSTQAPLTHVSADLERPIPEAPSISFDDTVVPDVGASPKATAVGSEVAAPRSEESTSEMTEILADDPAVTVDTTLPAVRTPSQEWVTASSVREASKKFDRVLESFMPKSEVASKPQQVMDQSDLDELFTATIQNQDASDARGGVQTLAVAGPVLADRAEMEQLNDVVAVEPTLLAAPRLKRITEVPSGGFDSEPWEMRSVTHIVAPRETPKPAFDGPERVIFAKAVTGIVLDKYPPRRESASKSAVAADIPAAFDVEVSNGAGRSRLAARVSAYLKSQDMPVSYLTNARRYDHMTTIIFHKPGMRSRAEAFAAKLPIAVELQESTDQYSDVRILLGGDILDFDREKLYLADIGAPNA